MDRDEPKIFWGSLDDGKRVRLEFRRGVTITLFKMIEDVFFHYYKPHYKRLIIGDETTCERKLVLGEQVVDEKGIENYLSGRVEDFQRRQPSGRLSYGLVYVENEFVGFRIFVAVPDIKTEAYDSDLDSALCTLKVVRHEPDVAGRIVFYEIQGAFRPSLPRAVLDQLETKLRGATPEVSCLH